MKVIGKRKPFKTNNLSGVLYSLHISVALLLGGVGTSWCHKCFGGK